MLCVAAVTVLSIYNSLIGTSRSQLKKISKSVHPSVKWESTSLGEFYKNNKKRHSLPTCMYLNLNQYSVLNPL